MRRKLLILMSLALCLTLTAGLCALSEAPEQAEELGELDLPVVDLPMEVAAPETPAEDAPDEEAFVPAED